MQSLYARLRQKPLASLGIAAAALVALWLLLHRDGDEAEAYRAQAVDRGEILRAVSATGQLQPLVTVNVGSTVSGPVTTVEVDFNSPVKANQVLARIDPQSFEAKVSQLRAGVGQAQANLASAQGDYARYKILADEGFASDQLMMQQRTAVKVSQANVATAMSLLNAAQIDLNRTVIRSPVDGVVVSRQVDPGQSVAASFQAPVLFQIAQDLAKLEAAIAVDEADIGDVREGQAVLFTVDAFPGDTFEGRVVQVRKQGAATQGVVSYTVMVEAGNPRGLLLPGMTANAEIIIERKANVLRAPNAALRFKPSDEKLLAQAIKMRGAGGSNAARQNGGDRGQAVARIAERLSLSDKQKAALEKAYADARANTPAPGVNAEQSARRKYQRKVRDAAMAAIEPSLNAKQKAALGAMRTERDAKRVTQSVLWVLRDKKPAPVSVQLGVASDSYTEIVGGELKEGDLLITGGGPKPATNSKSNNSIGGPQGGMRIRGA